MFDTVTTGNDWGNRFFASFLSQQQTQFRIQKGVKKPHSCVLIYRRMEQLFCQYFEPVIIYHLNISFKRWRKAGITSASNHGFFLIQAVLRQLGCGKGM